MGIKDASGRNLDILSQRLFPKESALAREKERLKEKHRQPSMVEVKDLDQQRGLVERLRRVARENAWESLSRSETTRIILSLNYQGNGQLEKDESRIVTDFLDFLASGRTTRSRNRMFSRVASQYLLNFDRESWIIHLMGRHLSERARTIDDPRHLAPLLEAHSDLGLFNWERGPDNLAKHIVEKRKIANDVFDHIGLHENVRRDGLVKYAFTLACNLIHDRLCRASRIEDIAVLRDWVLPSGSSRIIYDDQYKNIAGALLAPWKDPHRFVPPDICECLIRFFSEQFGDPRISPQKWRDVDPSDKDVLLRWLNLDTLALFFDIVREVVVEGGRFEHQWRAREQFWEEFVKHGFVTNSAVAFGLAGIPKAQQAEKVLDRKLLYRRLRGLERTQSVLLLHLRILSPTGSANTFVVADWSHNGSLRIWKASNPKAPHVALVPTDIDGPHLQKKTQDTSPIRHSGPWQSRAYHALLELSGYTHLREVESMIDFLEIVRV